MSGLFDFDLMDLLDEEGTGVSGPEEVEDEVVSGIDGVEDVSDFDDSDDGFDAFDVFDAGGLDDDEELDELDDGLDGLDEGDEVSAVLPSTRSRVVRAMRLRALRQTGDDRDHYGVGYARGYADALRAAGLAGLESEEVFGSLLGVLGTRAAGQVAGPLARGLFGPEGPGRFFEDLGRGIGEGLGLRRSSSGQTSSRPRPSSPVKPTDATPPVEASGEELPPVYVADEEGVSEAGGFSPEDEESFGAFSFGDRFGPSVRAGWIGSSPRSKTREAVGFALAQGTDALSSVSSGRSAPFLEDPGACPVLRGDGRVTDVVYGVLCAVPCPSCSGVRYGAVRRGQAATCGVCDGYGAILVPGSDLPEWRSVRYGFLGALLLPALAGGLILGREGEKRGWFAKLRRKMAKAKEGGSLLGAGDADLDALETEDEEGDEVSPATTSSRVLVPAGGSK